MSFYMKIIHLKNFPHKVHKDTYAKRKKDHKAAQGFPSRKSLCTALWTTRRPNLQWSLVHHKGLHKARYERYDGIRRNAHPGPWRNAMAQDER